MSIFIVTRRIVVEADDQQEALLITRPYGSHDLIARNVHTVDVRIQTMPDKDAAEREILRTDI